MRIIIAALLLAVNTACAGGVTLQHGQDYVVPENTYWVIKNVPPADCRVCTADVYIQGDISNVAVAGVVFHGNFDFSFAEQEHGEIKLYPGTRIRLGDSRRELVVHEESR